MKCPECLNAVDNDARTCHVCGVIVGSSCGHCFTINRKHSKFCNTCGWPLHASPIDTPNHPHPSDLSQPLLSATTDRQEDYQYPGERKLVTVLFSDLSGYSGLCERLDPEDVREMMNLVFKEIVGIILRYDGYIDRIIGDEVLAVFGIPRTHEDDPIRAIRAALAIHKAVAKMTNRFKERLERPLAMHSGIATGMVVTGRTDLISGRHGITGDTVNRASVLTNLAATGEILVETATRSGASGFFLFEASKIRIGGGTATPADAHRVLGVIKKPDKIRRLKGLRSRLIGRKDPMKNLHRCLAVVARKKGTCVFLEGDAGTGKSRLISDFKLSLDQHHFRWLQGNAYAYYQNVPYFPLIDLLGRAVDVRDGDSQEKIRQKLTDELKTFSTEDGAISPIIERLFALSNDNVLNISPETWKIKLKPVLVSMIEKLASVGGAIICIEDLHWADPSTVELLSNVLNTADLPVFFLISYRPGHLAFNHSQITNPYYHIECIKLKELSPQHGEEMARSMLQSDYVPRPLLGFISDRLGGNPFFLEEMINSLVDTGGLVKRGGFWEVCGDISATTFSSNISAVIAARLDRLSDTAKRIMQEASVIGRQFSPAILKQITSEPECVDENLASLKELGFILDIGNTGGNSCQFKHALVQEVAYNSLLKRQRRNLHEKIARILKCHNPDRIDAFCEILAYHYSNGHSLLEAVFFLKQSGRKGLKKYAAIEAHNYYEKAYQILVAVGKMADEASSQTVALLLEWFFVFNMRGRYEDALVLMKRHESMAMNDVDFHLKGMYLACMGLAYQRREQLNLSRHCLLEALSIGDHIHDYKVIAYSCAGLIWTCTDMGRLEEALAFSTKAEKASQLFESEDPTWSLEMDQDLVRFVLLGTAVAHLFKGDCGKCHQMGARLLAYGNKADDVNSVSAGHQAHGMGCFAAGDYRAAIEEYMIANDSSANPLYTINARFLMAHAHLSLGEVARAEKNLQEIMSFCNSSGYEYLGSSANLLSSVVAVAKGNIGAGVKAIDRHIRQYLVEGKHYHAQTSHYLLGSIYLKIVLRENNLRPSKLIKNLPFFLIHYPGAAKKAEYHLKTAIRTADRINAMGIKAQAMLSLGRLYQLRKKNNMAFSMIEASIALFEVLGAERHLEQAQATLASMA